MKQRASLVGVLLLLASVGTASAECAWVRAGAVRNPRPIVGDPIGWSLVRGYSTKWECAAAGDLSAKNPKNKAWEYRCLPDTVDPRGPKEK